MSDFEIRIRILEMMVNSILESIVKMEDSIKKLAESIDENGEV
jgi:hypothetical protein